MRVLTIRPASARRSNVGCGSALAIGVLVFLVVSLVAAALFVLSPSNNNASALFLHAQPNSLRWNTHERLTALLLGTNGPLRKSRPTDTMMIVSYDPHARSLSLLSIPGNLWVTVPGYGPARIAEAYAEGGPRLALLVAESVMHVPIPYYLAMGSDSLRQVVDGLGGVTLDEPHAHAGSRAPHLNGIAAVRYAAITYSSPQATVAGMERQQQLLLALKSQSLQPQSFFQIPAIVNALGASIDTNFPFDRVQALERAVLSVPGSRVHRSMLDPAHHAVTPYGTGQQQVLLPAWQNIRAMAQSLFGAGRLQVSGGVEVLNGAGQSGQAATLAEWLRKANVSIRGYDSAPSFGYQHTQVVVTNPAIPGATHVASAVAALLQAPLVTGHVGRSRAPVVVIIGHDYQDPSQE